MGLDELMDFHVGVQLAALDLDDAALRRFLAGRFVESSRAALAESREVLAALARDYAVGVVSNFYGNVERILDDAGFGALLGVVADSTLVGAAKPERAIFDFAVARLRTPAAATLHVGDSYERDVLAARAAGLRAAWLKGDRNTVGEPEAEVCLASLHDLREWLARG
jgi:putative hydrolase of the HAD superfamily